jgi:hypothetical protein
MRNLSIGGVFGRFLASLTNHDALIWVVLIMMACLLTLGLCWALLQARISGQAVVEEVKR